MTVPTIAPAGKFEPLRADGGVGSGAAELVLGFVLVLAALVRLGAGVIDEIADDVIDEDVGAAEVVVGGMEDGMDGIAMVVKLAGGNDIEGAVTEPVSATLSGM